MENAYYFGQEQSLGNAKIQQILYLLHFYRLSKQNHLPRRGGIQSTFHCRVGAFLIHRRLHFESGKAFCVHNVQHHKRKPSLCRE